MDNVSVSKGVFIHKGSYKIGQRKKTEAARYTKERWYAAFQQAWGTIEEIAEDIRSNMTTKVMSNLITLVRNAKENKVDVADNEIPTAILLTGVNIPDHDTLFHNIISQIRTVTPHVALVWSRDYNVTAQMTEEAIYQFANNKKVENAPELKKCHCTMRTLKAWNEKYCDQNDPLVVILPDFESFSANALHDFVLILSSYANTMKFVLIFGVATSLHSVHRSLSYDVSSKLVTQVFHMQSQVKSLSDVFDGIVVCPKTPFRLTGKAFQLLMDIFLFYDFSVDGFLQNYKVCMIQHFYGNNINSLCCPREHLQGRINELTNEDIVEIKKLPSIAQYCEELAKNGEKDIDTVHFKVRLKTLLKKFHKYMNQFFTVLKCLYCLVGDLPNEPLGKQKLLKMSQKHSRTAFKQAQLDLINYLDRKVFSVHLMNPSRIPANEIFCYSDVNMCKHHIHGSLRAAMHTGLNDPQVYLECDCCKLENDDAIPSTLPDLSIIYKLHLEFGKLINMYDWLQAFRTIADPDFDDEDQSNVDPKIQARFTRAVAELQFLGFIKSSRIKTDHVRRLT